MPVDEELPQPRRRPLPRVSRPAGVLAIVVVAATLVLVALYVGRDRTTPRAAPRPTVTISTPAATASPAASVSSPPKPACLDVGGSTYNCGITGHLPRAAVAAVQRLLPGATVTAASTVTGRDGAVYSRQATLRTPDGSTLQLRIGPRTGQEGSVIVPGLPEATVVQFAVDRGRRHVELVVRTPAGVSAPDVARLRSLAADPRLLAVR